MKKSILILALTAMIASSFVFAEEKGKKCSLPYPTDSITAEQAKHYEVKKLILNSVGVPGSAELHVRNTSGFTLLTCETLKRPTTAGFDKPYVKAQCDDGIKDGGFSMTVSTGGQSGRDIAIIRAKSKRDTVMVSRLRCDKK